jgi:hypothetical protein
MKNPVKKNMDKFHKPQTHRDRTKYSRKSYTLKELNEEIEPVKRKWLINVGVYGTWWETWEVEAPTEEEARDMHTVHEGKRVARYEHSCWDESILDVKPLSAPICILCKHEEVEMEDGEPTSSYCNTCFFDVLIMREQEFYILEYDAKEMGYKYKDVPAQILNPFDSLWEDLTADDDYYEDMISQRELSPHLKKWKDIPQREWGEAD